MSVDKKLMEVLEKNQNIKVVHFYNLCEKLRRKVMENIRGNTNQK